MLSLTTQNIDDALLEHWESKSKYSMFTVQLLPSFQFIQEPAFLGSWSLTTVKTLRRILVKKILTEVDGMVFTPSELARVYLKAKFPNRRKRMRGEQIRACKSYLQSPLFAKRGRWGECSYLDLKSAYWSIMNLVGWDIDYHPNNWLKLGTPPDDFPWSNNKLARNCLVSLTLPSKITFWTGSKITYKGGYNPNLNYGLYCLVMDTLQGIALDMVRAGAVYVHTDGYIIPDKKLASAREIIAEWGFTGSIKAQGDTEIFSTGSYRVGRNQTKIIHDYALQTNNIEIDPTHAVWLKKRLSYCSRHLTR